MTEITAPDFKILNNREDVEQYWLNKILETASAPLQEDKLLPTSEWVEKHWIWPTGPNKGGRAKLRGYQKGVLALLDNPETMQVNLVAAAQIGKTQMALQFQMSHLMQKKQDCIFYQPTGQKATQFSSEIIKPTIEAIPLLKNNMRHSDISQPGRGNNATTKEFNNGILNILNSSEVNLRSKSSPCIGLDEVSSITDLPSSGSVIGLALNRQATFPLSTLLVISTPKLDDGTCLITEAVTNVPEHLRFFREVPCPHCGAWSGALNFEMLKWTKKDSHEETAKTTECLCSTCGSLWDQSHMVEQDHKGRFTNSDGSIIANDNGNYFKVTLDDDGKETLSPMVPPQEIALTIHGMSGFRTWPSATQEFLEATDAARTGQTAKLQVFINEFNAEPFSTSILHNDVEPHQLEKHVLHGLYENDDGKIPDRIKLICTAVDVQDGHVHCLQVAFSDGMEIFILHQSKILMDTTQAKSFDAIEQYNQQRIYTTDTGRKMKSEYIFIDSRFRTEGVYAFCAKEPHHRYAIAGHGEQSRAIFDVPNYRREKGAYQLKVGVHQGKSYLHSRWNSEQKTIYISSHPSVNNDTTFSELTGEVLRSKQVNGRKVWYFRPRTASQRVEALDCLNYAVAGAMMLATYSPNVSLDLNAPIKYELMSVESDGGHHKLQTRAVVDDEYESKTFRPRNSQASLEDILNKMAGD